MSARRRTAELLEAHRPNDPLGRAVDLSLILLILANVGAIVLESVPGYRLDHRDVFRGFETVSVIVFTLEYALRLWSAPELPDPGNPARRMSRTRWALSPLGLIDLLAILPFYIYLLLPEPALSLLILRVFRALRLLRIFKLARYSPALNMLLSVIRKEAGVLTVAASILFLMLVVGSWGIYVLEREVQPDSFGSIPDAMWWAIITLTTIGYGDVVPVTEGGRLFAGLVALVGVGMMALPAAILASGFYREAHGRSETYKRAIEMALSSGHISAHEAGELETLREELGIDSDDAMGLLIQARHERIGSHQCPHCGAPLGAAAKNDASNDDSVEEAP